MDSKHAGAKSLLGRALANVESAAGRHLRGDLGRAAAFIEDALKALDGASVPAQPGAAAPLTWTREKPKVDGWYWYRVPGQAKQSIDLVQLFTGSPCWHSAERHAWVPITWDLEWSGPIPEPGAPASSPSQDSQEVGEYPIMLVDNLRVCEGCLKGVGQMCHTPGCAFIRSRSLDMDVRESILLNGGTIRPEVAALSQSPKGAAVVGDQGREWWLKTYRKNGEEIAYQIRETAPINSRGAVIKQGWVHVREVVEAAGGESAPSAPKTGLRGAPRQEDGATLDAIRPVIEDIEDSARVAAGGFQGQPTYWTFNVFEDIRKKARALLELLPSKTKPAPGDVGSAGGDKA